MALVFQKSGDPLRQNFVRIVTQVNGVSRDVTRIVTSYQGVNQDVWHKLESHYVYLTDNLVDTEPVYLYITTSNPVKVTLIGKGGDGGLAGSQFALNSGQGGGGGGGGGVAVFQTSDFGEASGNNYLLQIGRLNHHFYVTSNRYGQVDYYDGIYAMVQGYSQNMWNNLNVYVSAFGRTGGYGEDASITNLYPDGGGGLGYNGCGIWSDIQSVMNTGWQTQEFHAYESNTSNSGWRVIPDSFGSGSTDGTYQHGGVGGIPTQNLSPYVTHTTAPQGSSAVHNYDYPDLQLGGGGGGAYDGVTTNHQQGLGAEGGIIIEEVI